jgi:glycine/D-amino acid oxidase-like deaminating enzyme
VVVGAGIVGLAHAALAAECGLSVLVIDRDHRAVGASIRNFGHCCITAQTGDLYELAITGRKHWLAYSERAGFWATESGALVAARTATELRVLQELAERREPGQVVLLSAAETSARLGRVAAAEVEDTAAGPFIGGAWLRDDLRVDPRTTVASLAAWLDLQRRRRCAGTSPSASPPGPSGPYRTSRGDGKRTVCLCVGDVDA